MPILWPFKGESLGLQGLMIVGSIPAGNTYYGRALVYSPDNGTTWIPCSTTGAGGNAGIPLCVCYGQDMFVMGGVPGPGATIGRSLFYTTDGVNWEYANTPLNGVGYFTNLTDKVYSIAYGNNVWVALGYHDPIMPILVSVDGINWTISNSTILPANGPEARVIWDAAAGSFVIMAGTNVWTSPDGVNWTGSTLPVLAPGGGIPSRGVG